MKRLLIPVLLVILNGALFAQKVEIEGEDVIVDGASWCKIYKQKSLLNTDFTLATSDGTKFLMLKYVNEKCQATWLGKGITFAAPSDACLPRYLVKQLYNLDVLEDGQVNESGLQDFVSMSKEAVASQAQSDDSDGAITISGSSGDYEMVERDRSRMIQVFGEDIKQDMHDIGRITKDTDFENGQTVIRYEIFLPSGQLVATARYIGNTSLRGEIITAKDRRKHYVTAESGINRDKAVIQLLVRMLYL